MNRDNSIEDNDHAFSTDSPECKDCPLRDDCTDKRMALCRVMSNAYAPVCYPIVADISESAERAERLRKAIEQQLHGEKQVITYSVEMGDIRGGTGDPIILDCATGERK